MVVRVVMERVFILAFKYIISYSFESPENMAILFLQEYLDELFFFWTRTVYIDSRKSCLKID
jgi:hypothetical protein